MSKIYSNQLTRLQSASAASSFSPNTNYLDFLIDENEQYDFRATASSPTNEAQAPPQQPFRASQLPVYQRPLRGSQLPVVTSIFSSNTNYLDLLIDENEPYDFRATASSSTNEAQTPPQLPLPPSQLYDNLDKNYNSPQFISPLKSGDFEEKKSSWSSELSSGSPKFLNSRDSINDCENQELSLSLNSLDSIQSPPTSLLSRIDSENQVDSSSRHPVDENEQTKFTVDIGFSASQPGVFESELTQPGEVNSASLFTPLIGHSGTRGQLNLPPIPFLSRARLKPHARTKSLRSPTMASNIYPREIIGKDFPSATTGTNPHLPSKGLPAEQLVVSGSLCVNDTGSCPSSAPCRKLEMKSMSPYEAMSLVLRTDRRVDQLTTLGDNHHGLFSPLSSRSINLAPGIRWQLHLPPIPFLSRARLKTTLGLFPRAAR